MPLNFHFDKMIERLGREEYDRITSSPATRGKKSPQWHIVTDCLIWASMSLGLGSITEENVDEWTWRMSLWQRLRGPHIKTNKRAIRITREDIENHIGMITNVADETRRKWLSRALKNYNCFHEAKNFRRDDVGNTITKSAWELVEETYSDAKKERAA